MPRAAVPIYVVPIIFVSPTRITNNTIISSWPIARCRALAPPTNGVPRRPFSDPPRHPQCGS